MLSQSGSYWYKRDGYNNKDVLWITSLFKNCENKNLKFYINVGLIEPEVSMKSTNIRFSEDLNIQFKFNVAQKVTAFLADNNLAYDIFDDVKANPNILVMNNLTAVKIFYRIIERVSFYYRSNFETELKKLISGSNRQKYLSA